MLLLYFMIKSKSHVITFAFCEISALEKHLDVLSISLESFANGVSYLASHHGVTMYCTTAKQAEKIWNATLEATDDEGDNE